MTLADSVEIEDPPTELARRPPSDETFNAIFAQFFEGRFVDLTGKGDVSKLTERYKGETSNHLYAYLKKREKTFDKTILVSPAQLQDQQIIIVSARVVYKEFFHKSIQIETIHIVFDNHGKFMMVRFAPGQRKDL